MNFSNRQFYFLVITFLYFLPVLFLTYWSLELSSPHEGWKIWSAGLLFVSLFSLIFYICTSRRESILIATLKELPSVSVDKISLSTKVSLIDNDVYGPDPLKPNTHELELLHQALLESRGLQDQLLKDLEDKTTAYFKLSEEHEKLLSSYQRLYQEFSEYQVNKEELLKEKNFQISTLQQNLDAQKTEMEQRQDQISQLDGKIHDLSYEIRTLLRLNQVDQVPVQQAPIKPFSPLYADVSAPKETQNPTVVSSQTLELLKKCMQIAQKMTGANYLTNDSSRYREFSSSYFGIDQRRLYDQLRHETGGMILVLAPRDYKPLFVNAECKNILGWLPEKVMSDFPSIIQETYHDWKKTLISLKYSQEPYLRLLAKTREGKEVLLDSHLGLVSQGIFKDYAIAVASPS